MTNYRITFIYGTLPLWADVVVCKIEDNDRRGFADLAQIAVNNTLELLHLNDSPNNHIAHSYVIWEMDEISEGKCTVKMVYSFDTLLNE